MEMDGSTDTRKIEWKEDSAGGFNSWVNMRVYEPEWATTGFTIGSYRKMMGQGLWRSIYYMHNLHDESLSLDMTEEQVREHMTMKYLLLRDS